SRGAAKRAKVRKRDGFLVSADERYSNLGLAGICFFVSGVHLAFTFFTGLRRND
ncbi:MAG: hypothetical protein H6Q04_3330, partial [Acidobacteria bacterium]|nr:hypothetical protein [Acidobacteriota bacterium]